MQRRHTKLLHATLTPSLVLVTIAASTVAEPLEDARAAYGRGDKGLQVGKRDGFTPAQVKRIRGVLKARGAGGVRDLALFSTAIDTMLHGHNLLALVVADVQSRNGSIRTLIDVAQSNRRPP